MCVSYRWKRECEGRVPLVSDEELVLYALLGSLEAFDELVRRYRSAVMRVAYQELGDREAAEDAAQDALLLAFKALPQLQDPCRFAGWLCAITRRRARRLARGECRLEPTEPSILDRLILEQSQELSVSPQAEAIQSLEAAVLREVVEGVPSPYRLVLQLRYFDEWPIARIAEFLSLPVTTVKWRLHQGLNLVRQALGQANETGVLAR